MSGPRDSVLQARTRDAFSVAPAVGDEDWLDWTGRPGFHADDEIQHLNVRRPDGSVVCSFSLMPSLEDGLWADETLRLRNISGPYFECAGEPLYLMSLWVVPEARGSGAFCCVIAYLELLERPVVCWFTNARLRDHFDRNYLAGDREDRRRLLEPFATATDPVR